MRLHASLQSSPGNRRLKVLVSAYACEPGQGSEPGEGWNWIKNIARSHNLWVITRCNNKEIIQHSLDAEPLANIVWLYFDLPKWARFWKRGQKGIRLYYCLWQIGAYFVVRGLHRKIGFDLAHHFTFGTYWMPSFLPLLNIPFSWGPLGGAESAPPNFHSSFGLRGHLFEWFRDIARWLGAMSPITRMTAAKATFSLAKTPETASELERIGAKNVLLCQAGIPTREFPCTYKKGNTENSFRIISVGRLVHWKGFHLSMRAFSAIAKDYPTMEYWLIGDGPERKNLGNLATELKVRSHVRFWGSIARSEVMLKMNNCNVLVHPSLHDSGGWVCLEAMRFAKPVICLDLGGPATQVTQATGFRIHVESPEQVVRDLATAMKTLISNPKLCEKKGIAGAKRAKEHFDWIKKGEWLSQLMTESLG